MNKSKLKSYAPQARKDFIAMVTGRAAQLGISEAGGTLQLEPCLVQGDVAIIAGQAFPKKLDIQRKQLIAHITQHGFSLTMEAIAYTWFNRFAALRYMELHNYLGHGQRVLSSTTPGSLPDLLTHAVELVEGGDLPGISRDEVATLKLANKDGELYKRLLIAQCNALARAMPFLFEKIDDISELLLPDNLLKTDSVINKLVDSIDEADWDQVEIIGWLYQFYISEKKDQVIGKVVKSEDIPAATQLFTPNWIVKYLVQNSVGSLWLQANPGSTLASQWVYYIQPAEQSNEVNAQLNALIQARIAEDGDTLNPESITVLDPACGSGHILVEAYDLLKAIYLERGYRERDIPRHILEKNLYGLDIDDRAAQLAGFALLMKARADDRRLFDDTPNLNVHALQNSAGLDDATMAEVVLQAAIQAEGGSAIPSGQLFGGNELSTQHSSGLSKADLRELIQCFAHGKTFGSLITIPPKLAVKLPKLAGLLAQVLEQGDDLSKSYAQQIWNHFYKPASALAMSYDAVVANPPYMGSRSQISALKDFIGSNYSASKPDVYGAFLLRSFFLAKSAGMCALITRHGWMTNLRFADLRGEVVDNRTIINLIDLGAGAFPEISGEVVQATAFTISPIFFEGYGAVYFKLNDVGSDLKESEFLSGHHKIEKVCASGFKSIPGDPIVYSATSKMREAFVNYPPLCEVAIPRQGMATGNDDKFIRRWFEVSWSRVGLGHRSCTEAWASGKKWFPFNKGGSFRKWYGNSEFVISFDKESYLELKKIGNHCPSEELYFKEAVGWSDIATRDFAARYRPEGEVFATVSMSVFPSKMPALYLAAFLNSKVNTYLINLTSPGLHYSVGYVANQPTPPESNVAVDCAKICVEIAKEDWDEFELSMGFSASPLVKIGGLGLDDAWSTFKSKKELQFFETKKAEEINNSLFIDEFGLNIELDHFVKDDDITIYSADRVSDAKSIISYAIGCMMGRYSLDEPGLIYAHAGNVGFEPQRYLRFPADADGIVPVSDMPWFTDDVTQRVKEFLVAVWGQNTLAENLLWVADSQGRKADESAEDALRRYIAGSFFKDHLQTYKKRPIYWLFSSGKQKAFEALVYLHRYNEGTLARMRAEYVVPLTGKMADRIRLLEDDASKATTGAAKKKLDKDIDKLKKKLEELRQYDEKLRHYADMRISLDLDDGVKVNYGKFGDLLDSVKAITGGDSDD